MAKKKNAPSAEAETEVSSEETILEEGEELELEETTSEKDPEDSPSKSNEKKVRDARTNASNPNGLGPGDSVKHKRSLAQIDVQKTPEEPITYEEKLEAEVKSGLIKRADAVGKDFAIELPKGNEKIMHFPWGHLFKRREAFQSEDGKQSYPSIAPRPVLKFCPKCGKKNKANEAAEGVCHFCEYDVRDDLKKINKDLPEGFKFEKDEWIQD